MNKPFYLLIFFCGLYWQAADGFVFPEPDRSIEGQQGVMASKILQNLADSNPRDNVVFSPLSVHAAMTLLYLGAEGKTAQELRRALLPPFNKVTTAEDYRKFGMTELGRNVSDFELRMASALVVNKRYQVPNSLYPLAQALSTSVGRANFSDGDKIVRVANYFVEQITKSKIRNILEEGSIDSSNIAVLVNALYLKAQWESPFSEQDTRRGLFHLDSNNRIEVDMMINEGEYRYAEISKLKATVLELPYKNTDLTMLIVLPDRNYSLTDVENKIRAEAIDWNDISDSLALTLVNIVLPKFKIEFEMDVKEQFEKLGVHEAFGQSADFSGLFLNSGPGGVEKIKHKAFLEVNELGTEGAAATAAQIGFKSGFAIMFNVNRPFVFVIRNKNAVFFIGHVAKP